MNIEEKKAKLFIEAEELEIVKEIHRDQAYLNFMKNRWDIDFKKETFGKRAREAGIDRTLFFEDPTWSEYDEEDYRLKAAFNF